jgi:chromosome segregation ATPase
LFGFKQKNSVLLGQLELRDNELSEAKEHIESHVKELSKKLAIISTQKSYIELQGKKLLDFEQKNSVLLEQLETRDNELFKAKENIELHVKELSKKITIISTQKSSIELLLIKKREFENETDRLKMELLQVEKKLSDSQEISNGLEAKLMKIESDLNNKNKMNQSNIAEIERLKNLKWYDKLVRKK